MKNYLPFALRETRLVALTNFAAGVPPTRSSVQIQSFDTGFGLRTILGDLAVYAYDAVGNPSTQLLMRMGWLGKGFLLEKRIPAGLFINKSRPIVPTWVFEKPYILWPNQNLRARTTIAGDRLGAAGLVFHGRRLVDDRPCHLYDTTETAVAAGNIVGYVDRTLRCPGDSPVELYSVTSTDWDDNPRTAVEVLQIWSPQGRPWFQQSPFAAAPPAHEENWISPPVDLFHLGEEDGWVIEAGQTFLVEFENISTVNINVQVTLRGSIEIEEEARNG